MERCGVKIGRKGLLYRMVAGSKEAPLVSGDQQQPLFDNALGSDPQSGLACHGIKYRTATHRLAEAF